jgi:hypothetical protein
MRRRSAPRRGSERPRNSTRIARAAAAPFEIPARGWKDILLRVHLGLAQASGLMLKIMRCA